MKTFHRLAVLALAVALHATPLRAADAACGRACLEGLLAQYLAALDAHDPSRLPLARQVKFTENTVRLEPGDGFWQTIDRGSQSAQSRLVIADPSTSQVAFYGAAKENGHGVLFGVRLRIAARRITEIEQFVARRGPAQIGAFDDPPAFDGAWTQAVAPAERASRAELARIANLYFDGIERGNGDIVPLWDDCSRVENGFTTAPLPPLDGRPPMSIRESFNSGMFRYIREIRPRRVLLMDEERGIVYTMVMFQHPGNIKVPFWEKQYEDPTSVVVYPNSIGITESFKVRGGKISHITAQMVMLPYRQDPGWPLK